MNSLRARTSRYRRRSASRGGSILLLFASLLLVQCGENATEPEPPDLNQDWMGWEEEIPPVSNNIFYLDPAAGELTNPGTREEPLPSLGAVVEAGLIRRVVAVDHPYVEGAELTIADPDAPIGPGDTIVLLDGDHGFVEISESHAEDWVTIRADAGARPVLRGLELEGVERYRIQGLVIRSPEGDGGPSPLVFLESHGWRGPCRYIVVEECDVATVDDSPSWSAADWDERAASGIGGNGSYLSIRDNRLTNVNFGVSVSGRYALVERNTIENFCGDGMRGIGSDMVFEANTVMNCYDVNDNHDDGFQSWSINDDPPRERVVLRDNGKVYTKAAVDVK